MKIYPVGVNVLNKPVLVVGGGSVALRKVRGLVSAGARVEVVSPEIHAGIKRLAKSGKVRIRRSRFLASHIKSAHVLVFSCTDDPAVNRSVASASRRRRIWANVADDPRAGDFHLPAVSRRGPLTVALFSGGRAPAYVRQLRRRIDAVIGPAEVRRLRAVEEMRELLRRIVPSQPSRRAMLRRLVNSRMLDRISRANPPRRRALLRRFASQPGTPR